MKAEQRKELETNTLADKVGQAMQRVKGSSRRGVLIYFIVGAALVIALFLGYRWMVISKRDASEQWLMLDDGAAPFLVRLSETDTPAGRAASLQLAWLKYWEEGVRMIGVNPMGATKALNDAGSRYQKVAEQCREADDKILEPQALLGIAVVRETLAVQDPASLGQAKDAYKQIVEIHDGKYKDSAAGLFAQKRLEILNDKAKSRELENFYEDMQRFLQVPGVQQPFLPGMNPRVKGENEKGK